MRGTSAGRRRAWARGRRGGQLLRHLPRLPQPQERRPAAAAGRAVRPPARRPRPQPVRRAATPPRCCTRCSAAGVPPTSCRASTRLFFLFIPVALAFALVFSPEPAGRPLLRHRAVASTGCSPRRATSCCRRSGPIYAEPAKFAGCRPPASTPPAGLLLEQRIEFLRDPARGTRAEHRRLRLAARLDLLHRRAGDAPARARRGREDRGVGPVRPDRRRHDLLRLALRRSTTSPAWPSARRRSPWRGRSPASTCEPRGSRRRPELADLRRATPSPARSALGRGRAHAGAAARVLAGRRRRHRRRRRCSRPTRRACRCATPTTSPRSTSCWWASAWRCSSGSTSRCARPGASGAARRGRRCRACGASAGPRARAIAAGTALVSFYVTYMAYRNLKAIVPLLRPDDIFDRQLADLDRSLFLGHDPAELLHTPARRRGPDAHPLDRATRPSSSSCRCRSPSRSSSRATSGPASSTRRRSSVNWVLGAASYFLLPSLGPIYAEPRRLRRASPSPRSRGSRTCCSTSASSSSRDPATATPQSIAAFASLHISMSLTAALAAHLLGLGQAAEDRAVDLVRA